MNIHRCIILAAAICLSLILNNSSANASSALLLQDVVKAPVNLSISGTYFSSPQKTFSVEISKDRFIKTYNDGIIIIGVRDHGDTIYYIVDKNKKTILKVSQTNLYKTGQFFNWDSITSLVNLPGNSAVTAEGKANEGCTLYGVESADVRLCVDNDYHIPRFMTVNGTALSRIVSVRPLETDLRMDVDSIFQICRRQGYNFIDVDSDMDPDAD